MTFFAKTEQNVEFNQQQAQRVHENITEGKIPPSARLHRPLVFN